MRNRFAAVAPRLAGNGRPSVERGGAAVLVPQWKTPNT